MRPLPIAIVSLILGLIVAGLPVGASAQGDAVGPTLVGFSFAPTAVDTSAGDQTIAFALRVQDAGAGFSNGSIEMAHETQPSTLFAPFDGRQRQSGDGLDGTYRVQGRIGQGSPTGTWVVRSVQLFDLAGNERRYSQGDLAAAGFDTTLHVRSGPEPTVTPTPTATATGTPTQTPTLTPTYSPTPPGTPALSVYLPLIARVGRLGW